MLMKVQFSAKNKSYVEASCARDLPNKMLKNRELNSHPIILIFLDSSRQICYDFVKVDYGDARFENSENLTHKVIF